MERCATFGSAGRDVSHLCFANRRDSWTLVDASNLAAKLGAATGTGCFLIALIVGWDKIMGTPQVSIPVATLLAGIGLGYGARAWRQRVREAALRRAVLIPEVEMPFRAAFHGENDYVVNANPLGILESTGPLNAAMAKWSNDRIVKFKEIVDWVGRGAPHPLSLMQTIPHGAVKPYRTLPRRRCVPPEQMAIQLVESGVFKRHS